MADAKKCDICGTYYDRYNTSKAGGVCPNQITFQQETTTSVNDFKTYDACPNCLKDIADFIESRRNHGRN